MTLGVTANKYKAEKQAIKAKVYPSVLIDELHKELISRKKKKKCLPENKGVIVLHEMMWILEWK